MLWFSRIVYRAIQGKSVGIDATINSSLCSKCFFFFFLINLRPLDAYILCQMKYNVNTLWTYCNSVQEYQCIEDILQLFNIYILVSCGIILIRRGSGVFFFDFLDTPQPGLIIFKKISNVKFYYTYVQANPQRNWQSTKNGSTNLNNSTVVCTTSVEILNSFQ